MASAEYNITIEKHSDFSRTFAITEQSLAKDITGWSFQGQLRKSYTDPTAVSFTTVLVDIAQGLFKIYLTDDQTAAMEPGTWVYDVVGIDNLGDRVRLFGGRAYIKNGATQ